MTRSNAVRLLLTNFYLALLFLLPTITQKGHTEEKENITRPALSAGTFYPDDKSNLKKSVEALLAGCDLIPTIEAAKAIIVPHAAYQYSGTVAAFGFRALNKNFKKVVILTSNHTPSSPQFKFSSSKFNIYKTPLGEVKISRISRELLAEELFEFIPEAETSHIIEVQLPFLQTIKDSFEIIPIITNKVDIYDLDRLIEIIFPLIDDETALIASADLSHYQPYEYACEIDRRCTEAIAKIETEEILKCETCALPAIYILTEIAKRKGWQGRLLAYKNSGDINGQTTKVVGYASIAFYPPESLLPPPLSEDKQGEILLRLARQALEADLIGSGIPATDFTSIPSELQRTSPCFVTLKKDGDLRGCMGDLTSSDPLYMCVIKNISHAAKRDYRFLPLRKDEVKETVIEVSILTEPVLVLKDDRQKFVEDLKPNQDGIVFRLGEKEATFLPQVWQQITSKEEFLAELCKKAQLEPSCWNDKRVEIYKYQAADFTERQANQSATTN